VRAIKDLEHTCDDITHRTIDKLNSTFITPLEPEDIHTLVSRLDDIVDHIDSVAGRLLIYQVKAPTEEAKLLSQVLTRACVEVQKSVVGLRNMKDPEMLLLHERHQARSLPRRIEGGLHGELERRSGSGPDCAERADHCRVGEGAALVLAPEDLAREAVLDHRENDARIGVGGKLLAGDHD